MLEAPRRQVFYTNSPITPLQRYLAITVVGGLLAMLGGGFVYIILHPTLINH